MRNHGSDSEVTHLLRNWISVTDLLDFIINVMTEPK